jgi:N-acetyl-gamma-glutamyl-phosphate reductase
METASTAASTRSSSQPRPTLQPARVFIDGEAGTVGLGIVQRLAAVTGVEVVRIAPELRKDSGARQELMRRADLTVLCLPDKAAVEAVALADALGADAPKLLDASSAHRVAPGWTYGFPELTPDGETSIRAAARVTNPGCYPSGALALLRPLRDAGLIPADYPLTVNAISGYSGGGNSLIEQFEAGSAPAFKLYGLQLDHKHVPELQRYANLDRRPLFVPSVGAFRQGMLVSIPLHTDTLPGRPTSVDVHAVLARRYAGSKLLRVLPLDMAGGPAEIEPEALNGTDSLELAVFANDRFHQVVLVARLDNLGKGAAGAAIQNIALMLGLDA